MSTTGVAGAGTEQGQLDPGETVYPGQSIVSPNGQWSFEMQNDGNRHVAVVESRTAGEPEVVLQISGTATSSCARRGTGR